MNYILIRTVGILIASYITKVGVPLTLSLQTGMTAVIAALVIAIINHTIKPIISIMTLPINLLTLGLFSLVVNGAMILLAEKVIQGLGGQFTIPSLLMAIYFSIVLAIINTLLHIFEE